MECPTASSCSPRESPPLERMHIDTPRRVTLEAIEEAEASIRDALTETPCVAATRISQLTKVETWLKLESRQRTGSFKERGALAKLLRFRFHSKRTLAGVVTASTGNHAQALAYHGSRLGIPVTIVMPRSTPTIKAKEAENLGARVTFAEGSLAECEADARALAQAHDLEFVHPYADEIVVAGQGTVALEIIRAQPALDALIVPVGGGGLIAGISVAAKSLNTAIEIIGVQAARQPHLQRAVAGLEAVAAAPTIADGLSVESSADFIVDILREHVADFVLVSEEAIEAAIYVLLEQEKLVVEGAGAAGIAALMIHAGRFANKRVGVIISGGNIDPDLLANVIVRARLRNGSVACVRVEISDRPGALSAVSSLIAQAGANVIDLSHRRLFSDLSSRDAALDFMLELRDRGDARAIVASLTHAGFPTMIIDASSRFCNY
jgi:threonine dehydratase